MMTLSTAAAVALYVVLFFVLIFALVTIVLLGGIFFGLSKLNEKIDSALDAAKPLIVKSSDVLDTVQRVTMNVGERADTILSQGEEITSNLAKRVEHTANVVEKTVTSPLIVVSSVIAGVTRGFDVLNKTFARNGHAKGESKN